MKTDFIRARVEPHLKAQVHQIFDNLGMTPTQVITMLYKLVAREHKIPFDLSVPNRETAKAIREAREGKGVVVCKDAEDMFNKLGI